MRINGLILAAGESKRLNQTKQLVKYKGCSLLQHTELAITPWVSNMYVVLGYQHEKVQHEVESATIVINHQWRSGMGASISCGVKAARYTAEAILIALCDQPMIPSHHYQKMSLCAQQNPNRIITTGYERTQGVPVIFPQSYFNELNDLNSDQGAQSLLSLYSNQTISINCEAAAKDIDTPNQLKRL